jgi:hypothetical protein
MRISIYHKMSNKIINNFRTASKLYQKILETDKIDTPKAHIHNYSLSWFSTGISINVYRLGIILSL